MTMAASHAELSNICSNGDLTTESLGRWRQRPGK